MSHSTHQHTILYVEDDLDDLLMIRQAFEQLHNSINIVHARNGLEALQQLNQSKANNQLPCVIVLDINMPGMNGRDTLIRIRQSEDFKNISVVLFTTSSSELDRSFARKWGARFITKPLIYAELEELAQQFISFCSFSTSEKA